MNKTFDLITIGDSTIDTFIKIHDATIECDIHRKDCKICVPYGSKIPVDEIAYGVAGNAANVAVACAKLGLYTGIYTNLGDDDQGETIKETLLKEKVNDDYIRVIPGKKSNLSVVLTFQAERTIFVYHQQWDYLLPKLDLSKWIYLTSLGESFTSSNIVNEVCSYVDSTGAKLAFSPGTYQIKANVKRFPKILEKCEVLFVNKDEAKTILEIGPYESADIRDLLSKLLLLGPKTAVITDGSEGSYASDGNRNLKMGIFPAKLVEKTGAGDAYSAAFVAALIKGESIDEAMAWGTVNASGVIQKVGTQNGLYALDELNRYRGAVAELKASPN